MDGARCTAGGTARCARRREQRRAGRKGSVRLFFCLLLTDVLISVNDGLCGVELLRSPALRSLLAHGAAQDLVLHTSIRNNVLVYPYIVKEPVVMDCRPFTPFSRIICYAAGRSSRRISPHAASGKFIFFASLRLRRSSSGDIALSLKPALFMHSSVPAVSCGDLGACPSLRIFLGIPSLSVFGASALMSASYFSVINSHMRSNL